MIWLIGYKGMLGTEIYEQFKNDNIDFVYSDKEVDISDLAQLEKFADKKDISWIINCSAYTAVDKAESEFDVCNTINNIGVGNIAKIAQRINAKLIHFSTDYVFDGENKNPYDEGGSTNPQSVYGKTKLDGENSIISIFDKYFIIRISWLYGQYGGNFVGTMLRLFGERDEISVVSDQRGTPTYALELAKNIINLIKSDSELYGVYHYSDNGNISWYDFALKIYKIAKNIGLITRDIKIHPIPTDNYPTPAKRPAFSLLNKSKIKSNLKFNVVDWEKNLEHYLTERQNNA